MYKPALVAVQVLAGGPLVIREFSIRPSIWFFSARWQRAVDAGRGASLGRALQTSLGFAAGRSCPSFAGGKPVRRHIPRLFSGCALRRLQQTAPCAGAGAEPAASCGWRRAERSCADGGTCVHWMCEPEEVTTGGASSTVRTAARLGYACVSVFPFSLFCAFSLFFPPVSWFRGKWVHCSTSLVHGRADEQLAPGHCRVLRPHVLCSRVSVFLFSSTFFNSNR